MEWLTYIEVQLFVNKQTADTSFIIKNVLYKMWDKCWKKPVNSKQVDTRNCQALESLSFNELMASNYLISLIPWQGDLNFSHLI